MGLPSPSNYDESNSFRRPYYPPKCESGDYEPALLTSGYFSFPLTLISAIPVLRLTETGITYLLSLMSRFNWYQYRGGEFSIADTEIGRILNTTPKTVRRERKKLVVGADGRGWLGIEEGGIIQGGLEPKYRRTRYLWLGCPGFGNGKAEPPFLKIERSTFEGFLLKALGNGITHRLIVADLTIRYFGFWAREGRPEPCSDFPVRKGKLRGLLGIQDTPELIKELSQVRAPDGEPLFEVEDKHRDLRIIGLRNYLPAASPTPEPCGHKGAVNPRFVSMYTRKN